MARSTSALRSAAQQANARASTSTATSAVVVGRALNVDRPRNQRQRRQDTRSKLDKLCNLHHMTSTFVPLDVTLHDTFMTNVLAPPVQTNHTPDMYSVSQVEQGLQMYRTNADAYSTVQNALTIATGSRSSSSSTSPASEFVIAPSVANVAQQLQNVAKTTFQQGSESPLLMRLRLVIDTLYGTSNGMKPGALTLDEWAVKANEFQAGINKAKREMQQDLKRQDDDAKAFERAWDDDKALNEQDLRR
ncbi:hypothetical protein OIO90_006126 [Microbotryomycetes sp. JL221]|nr:hypothetical protein OIO90_006126 [Microbotryomycetes sp. JL221]